MKIALFTWHSRKNLQLVLPLAEYLRERCGSELEFITSDTSGKILLGIEGYRASTVNELILAYLDDPDPDPADYDPELGALDLKVNWLWTPPDVVSPPAGAAPDSEAYRRWKVVQFLRAYHGFIREVQPQVVMTWNGTLAVTRCLTQAAARDGAACFFMERGLIPDTLVVDPRGVNYESALAGPMPAETAAPSPLRREELAALCRTLGGEARSIVNTGNRVDGAELRAQLGVGDDTAVILLPLQIENDTNIVENSPLVRSMVTMIGEVARAVEGLDYCVVVKPHPEDARRRDQIEAACAGPQLRCSWDHSLHSLLDISAQAIVINSTVGLEALMQNVPVIALGNSAYNQKGFTTDVEDFATLRDDITRPKTPPHEQPEFWRFLNRLMSDGLFSYDAADPWGNREALAARIRACAEERSDLWAAPPATERLAARRTVRDLLAGKETGATLVLGGLEAPFRTPPEHVAFVEDSSGALQAILSPARPEVLLTLQPRASLAKRVIARLLRPRRRIDIH